MRHRSRFIFNMFRKCYLTFLLILRFVFPENYVGWHQEDVGARFRISFVIMGNCYESARQKQGWQFIAGVYISFLFWGDIIWFPIQESAAAGQDEPLGWIWVPYCLGIQAACFLPDFHIGFPFCPDDSWWNWKSGSGRRISFPSVNFIWKPYVLSLGGLSSACPLSWRGYFNINMWLCVVREILIVTVLAAASLAGAPGPRSSTLNQIQTTCFCFFAATDLNTWRRKIGQKSGLPGHTSMVIFLFSNKKWGACGPDQFLLQATAFFWRRPFIFGPEGGRNSVQHCGAAYLNRSRQNK